MPVLQRYGWVLESFASIFSSIVPSRIKCVINLNKYVYKHTADLSLAWKTYGWELWQNWMPWSFKVAIAKNSFFEPRSDGPQRNQIIHKKKKTSLLEPAGQVHLWQRDSVPYRMLNGAGHYPPDGVDEKNSHPENNAQAEGTPIPSPRVGGSLGHGASHSNAHEVRTNLECLQSSRPHFWLSKAYWALG
jgi:hypothetical protein